MGPGRDQCLWGVWLRTQGSGCLKGARGHLGEYGSVSKRIQVSVGAKDKVSVLLGAASLQLHLGFGTGDNGGSVTPPNALRRFSLVKKKTFGAIYVHYLMLSHTT